MVYKTNESIIVIQAEAINPNRTDVVFWSHDRGTAKLRMKLVRKNGIPQSLPEGTTVPIRLMFRSATAEGGYGKHDYLATIDDRVNGIVSIVLEDNILGYVGTVEGSVYIDFPNDRSLDTAGRFTFSIKRSPIDDSTPELEDYYFNGFSQTIDKIEKILADGKQEIEQKIAESETQIDAKVKDTNDKITKANQDVATLDQNLTELRNDMKLSEAWAWSKDGTDRFTDKYPIDNLLPNSMFNSQMGWTASMLDVGSTQSGIANGEAWLEDLTATTSRWKQWQIYFDNNRYPDTFELIKANPNKRLTVSVDAKVEGNTIKHPGILDLSLRSSTGDNWLQLRVDETKISSEYIRYTAIGTLPSDFNNVQNFRLILAFNGNGRATFTKPKLAIGNDGFYTPAPSEDYENAYPQYRGLALLPSDLPDDYSWDITPEYTEKGLNDTVSLTEPQSVEGLKNFADGIQIAGDKVISENDCTVYTLTKDNSQSFIDGYATFIKHGKEVIVNGTVKFKKAYAFGVPLDDKVPDEFIARIVHGMLIGQSGTNSVSKAIYVQKDLGTIMTNSEFAANEWFTFHGNYWVGVK
ncbi:TPA: BppU family phage baseplate upper protein [Enterococcus faecium]